jgi:hypothetical protein
MDSFTAVMNAFATPFGGFFDAIAASLEAAGVPDPLLGFILVLIYVGTAYALAHVITRP